MCYCNTVTLLHICYVVNAIVNVDTCTLQAGSTVNIEKQCPHVHPLVLLTDLWLHIIVGFPYVAIDGQKPFRGNHSYSY